MRLVEVGNSSRPHYRIEQAVKDPVVQKWTWRPLAMCTEWMEAHITLHNLQANLMDKIMVRKNAHVQ